MPRLTADIRGYVARVTSRQQLLSLSGRDLAAALRHGHPIDPHALDDSQYRGISLGLPAWIERLSWKTFQKTFHRDPRTGQLRGWNVRVEQRGLDAKSVAKVRGGVPWSFGHYRVVELSERVPRDLRTGLLIDYSPERGLASRMRDPLVALDEGSVDRLLGWSYLDLGWFCIPTPSYFLLEREGPLERIVPRG
jgi:hypothetical protein